MASAHRKESDVLLTVFFHSIAPRSTSRESLHSKTKCLSSVSPTVRHLDESIGHLDESRQILTFIRVEGLDYSSTSVRRSRQISLLSEGAPRLFYTSDVQVTVALSTIS